LPPSLKTLIKQRIDLIMTHYKGFLIRATPTQWQAIRPLDATWLDGYQAKNRRDLLTLIDCHVGGF
jgi:hypothetical protein